MKNIIKASKELLEAFTIIFIIFATYSCSTLPGMNGEPKAQKGSKKITGQYSINDITINIIDVNKLNEDQIENYNNSKVKELKYSINEFPTIYNYKYEYALGSSDVISINLTDTDDVDGSYIIGPNGNIDLPYVGKINIENLTLTETKKKLISVLKKYYNKLYAKIYKFVSDIYFIKKRNRLFYKLYD